MGMHTGMSPGMRHSRLPRAPREGEKRARTEHHDQDPNRNPRLRSRHNPKGRARRPMLPRGAGQAQGHLAQEQRQLETRRPPQPPLPGDRLRPPPPLLPRPEQGLPRPRQSPCARRIRTRDTRRSTSTHTHSTHSTLSNTRNISSTLNIHTSSTHTSSTHIPRHHRTRRSRTGTDTRGGGLLSHSRSRSRSRHKRSRNRVRRHNRSSRNRARSRPRRRRRRISRVRDRVRARSTRCRRRHHHHPMRTSTGTGRDIGMIVSPLVGVRLLVRLWRVLWWEVVEAAALRVGRMGIGSSLLR